MSSQDSQTAWEQLRSKAGQFPPQAYVFVQEGLRATADRLHGDCPVGDRHISGRELCMGLREHAIDQYGLLAKTVLEAWNIHRTEDFGRIVFAMVDAGLLRKTEEDSAEDFIGVFDFDEAFGDELGRCVLS